MALKRTITKNKYNKKTYKQFKFCLNINTELHIIQQLESKENKSDYIKNLILDDMRKIKSSEI